MLFLQMVVGGGGCSSMSKQSFANGLRETLAACKDFLRLSTLNSALSRIFADFFYCAVDKLMKLNPKEVTCSLILVLMCDVWDHVKEISSCAMLF